MPEIEYEINKEQEILEAKIYGDLDFESAIEISCQTKQRARNRIKV